MSDSKIRSKQAYFGCALSGKYEPNYPRDEAFVDLEDILGDLMNYTISTATLATFAVEQMTLDTEKKEEALRLINEQLESMKTLGATLTRVVDRAKEIADGGN